MTEWRAEIVRVGKIDRHPYADNLSVTTIYGEYPAIFKTGEFNEGDLAIFLPYDTIVPDTKDFYFLAKPLKRDKDGTVLLGPPPIGQVPEKDRTIKAKKIRGIYSDCVILKCPEGFKEGDSVVEFLDLKKREYEEEISERQTDLHENSPSSFQLFKYDLEGFAKYSKIFSEDEEVLITEKIEGENFTAIYSEDRLWIRSRNFFKKDNSDSYWWEIARRLDLENKLKAFPNLAIWGELYGGIKGWKYDCQTIKGKAQRSLRVFDIFDIKLKKFLEWTEVEKICKELELNLVPVLYKGPFKNNEEFRNLAEGKSTIGDCVKEGIVMRSIPESWDEKLGRKIVKLKGHQYKLVKN